MYKIDESELMDIVESYGLKDLIFDRYIWVEPDTCLYLFHDKENAKYCLVASDYLGHYIDIDLPYDFKYDYYPDNVVRFHAVRRFSYVNNATKKAEGYIDDDYLWTSSSTGDICMLFACDEIEIKHSN